MSDQQQTDPAKARFFLITLNRLFGLIMILAGILGLYEVISISDYLAYALIAVGVVDFVVVPRILARTWRTPDQ